MNQRRHKPTIDIYVAVSRERATHTNSQPEGVVETSNGVFYLLNNVIHTFRSRITQWSPVLLFNTPLLEGTPPQPPMPFVSPTTNIHETHDTAGNWTPHAFKDTHKR